MSNRFFHNAKIENLQAQDLVCEASRNETDSGFYDTTMTALSLQLVSTSQNQQKPAVSPEILQTAAIYAGWNTDLYDKNYFNNQIFDSAVFLRSSDFKRHTKSHYH